VRYQQIFGVWRSLKILTLNYEFPPIGGGGGRVSQQIAAQLARRGHEVKVHTSWLPGLPRRFRQEGYEVIRALALRLRADTCTVPQMAAYVLCSQITALRLCLAWRPDVIHAHFAVPTGAVAWWLHRLLGIPYVLTIHLGDVPGGYPQQTGRIFGVIKPLTNPIWHSAKSITAVSNHVAQLSRIAYGLPVSVVHNGIDLERGFSQPAPPHDPLRMVFAGRFNRQKNLDFLINGLHGISRDNWRLDLLGDGPEMQRLVVLVRELDLTERIKFHGWVDPERVNEVMGVSDILLMPSISEGLPVVGLNALAHGLVIIGSNTGGINDLVRHGVNGWLGPVNDLATFVGLLDRGLGAGKEELRAMKQASCELAKQFDLKDITLKYERILMEAAEL
jgi:glycosyltransferase involved in cell wall biosynthesis